MQFFSGFSLRNEEYLFDGYIDKSTYNVCGFSYGAIKALNFVYEQLQKGSRVDRLQLLSPAFFQTAPMKFKKLQLMGYAKNKELYLSQFLKSCFAPYEQKIVETISTQKEELEELLYYEWDKEKLAYIKERGVAIEVYLGGQDAIVEASASKAFFINYATVTLVKDANHFLQTK